MNRRRLTEITKSLEDLIPFIQKWENILVKLTDLELSDIDMQTYAYAILGQHQSGISFGIDDLREKLLEIINEFKSYTATPPGQDKGVRVVRFRGDTMQAPARADVTKIIMEVPTKSLEKFVAKYGFEIFTDDLFDFCEREGW